mmetsp:Transcript_18698/g.57956  ORF Transcript_18698/g.57956 Transcript_18698/m.57956 type:complete len:221 (-) Transcript_18698:301-963(-)
MRLSASATQYHDTTASVVVLSPPSTLTMKSVTALNRAKAKSIRRPYGRTTAMYNRCSRAIKAPAKPTSWQFSSCVGRKPASAARTVATATSSTKAMRCFASVASRAGSRNAAKRSAACAVGGRSVSSDTCTAVVGAPESSGDADVVAAEGVSTFTIRWWERPTSRTASKSRAGRSRQTRTPAAATGHSATAIPTTATAKSSASPAYTSSVTDACAIVGEK